MIKYTTLIFKCSLFSFEDIAIPKLAIDIEYFNTQQNKWILFIKEAALINGKFEAKYSIPERLPREDKIERPVREAIEEGCIPHFRVIQSGSKIPMIISESPSFKINKSTLSITLDFQKLWLLEEKFKVQKESSIIIATPIQTEKIESIQDSNKEKDIELARLQKIIEKQNLTIEQEKKQKEEFIAQLEVVTEEKENLTQNSGTKNDIIEELNQKIEEEKTMNRKMINENQELYSKLEKTKEKLVAQEKQIKELEEFTKNKNPNKIEMTKVYKEILEDIEFVDKEMQSSKYKLSNISMNLKATIEKGATGTLLGLVDMDKLDAIDSASLSDITMDIVPNDTPKNNNLTVPNLLGKTETATRNIVTKYDLKLDVIYHPTENSNHIIGQSFKQYPEPGSNYVSGQEITVLFYKKMN